MATSTLPPSVTASALEAAATSAASGDARAWGQLMDALEPLIRWLAARRAGRRLSEAGHRDLFVRVVDRLRVHDRLALVQYTQARSQYRGLDFATYVAAQVASALNEYLQRRPDNERPRYATARELQAAVAHDDDVGESIEALRASELGADERRALLLWLHGNDPIDIAAELGLVSAEDSRRLLEAARAKLRRPTPEST